MAEQHSQNLVQPSIKISVYKASITDTSRTATMYKQIMTTIKSKMPMTPMTIAAMVPPDRPAWSGLGVSEGLVELASSVDNNPAVVDPAV